MSIQVDKTTAIYAGLSSLGNRENRCGVLYTSANAKEDTDSAVT